jgi:hypothetical protein
MKRIIVAYFLSVFFISSVFSQNAGEYHDGGHFSKKVEIKSIPISDQFAEKLNKKMVSFINNFKAKGIPADMADGYSVTFRTVVDDEVWSLGIHMPAGNAKIIADLCRQIITDANANQLEEPKYLYVLNNFGNQ